MKAKKLILTTMIAPSILSAAICGNNKSSANGQDNISFADIKTNISLDVGPLYTNEGLERLNSDPTDQSLVDSILDMLISKGG